MSEVPISRAEDLRPGDVVEFATIREVVAFEDMLAPLVEPYFDPVLWSSRPYIGDLIRPPKFNGNIADVSLTVMDDPYARLLDAHERGWKFGKSGGKFERSGELAEALIKRYQGFVLLAEARSSRRPFRGQIEAEMWYFPPAHMIHKAGTTSKSKYVLKSGEVKEYTYTVRSDHVYASGSKTGETIRRVVTQPRYERGAFERLHQTSRRIGFAVLRQNLTHPIIAPTQGKKSR